MFAEVCKAIASISDLNHHPSIELSSYSMDNSIVNTAANFGDVSIALGTAVLSSSLIHSGSFYVGLDLENYANSDKSQIFAGWNSSPEFVGSEVQSKNERERRDKICLLLKTVGGRAHRYQIIRKAGEES